MKMVDKAAVAVLSEVLGIQPGRAMQLSTLKHPFVTNWFNVFKPKLGSIKYFLLRYPDIFHVELEITGNYVVTMIVPRPVVQAPVSVMTFHSDLITDQLSLPRAACTLTKSSLPAADMEKLSPHPPIVVVATHAEAGAGAEAATLPLTPLPEAPLYPRDYSCHALHRPVVDL